MKPVIAFALALVASVSHAQQQTSSVQPGQLQADGATASFRGALPPKATSEIPREQLDSLKNRLADLAREFAQVKKHARAADADIFLKAVRYAIDFQEWYGKKPDDDLKKANALLDEAAKRIAGLKKDEIPWMNGTGLKILGFYSQIDDSPQPYGVEIPEGLAFGSSHPPVPMWIWLHGRGDTDTDLHFVFSRLNAKKPGQFQPAGTIVIHPFGRYCNGWKSAGETDVFEARDDAIARFHIDPNRIAIAGFSMGGAGAWHLGAHFADQWACVHTGAGFVDVKRYQKLTPNKMPPWYEQKLWGVYDVPNYARNFLNVPLVCYSGEIDAQRDSAEYMVEVLDKEGLHPPHLIGPGMGHKYHPEVLKDVQSQVESAVSKGRNVLPKEIHLQTRTLAYSRMHWLQITGLSTQWEDARADAKWDEVKNEILVDTKNVSQLRIELPFDKPLTWLKSTAKKSASAKPKIIFLSGIGRTRATNQPMDNPSRLNFKAPIDDGFKTRFLVVLPDGPTDGSAVEKWARAEADHFLVRWRSLMRGDPIVCKANEVSEQDLRDYNIAVWGTPNTNSLLQKLLKQEASTVNHFANVLTWTDKVIKIGSQEWPSHSKVPVLCYPNPLNTNRYIILNSGLTFREAHDKTNSLQNPKLPDWAILDITEPPTAESAGKVLAADFFDSHWQWIPRTKSPADRE